MARPQARRQHPPLRAILQRTLTAAYRRADYFTRNVRTIQVLSDRETILSGAAANGQPWKYYDLGTGYCTYDFFAKCPHRLACARCPFYLPKQSHAGQILTVKDGIRRDAGNSSTSPTRSARHSKATGTPSPHSPNASLMCPRQPVRLPRTSACNRRSSR
ncbi:MAG: hypothetical protein M3252_09165 [Actinomycetota bacterium]|nr:hypothetical protein [Actinomycetota bacterium]